MRLPEPFDCQKNDGQKLNGWSKIVGPFDYQIKSNGRTFFGCHYVKTIGLLDQK
jgi:hypothetical protein